MTTVADIPIDFHSKLSLQPLIAVLKKMILEGKPGAKKLYEGILNEVEASQELQQPIINNEVIQKNALLIETLLSTIFPPSTIANEGIYAVSYPFSSETVHTSPSFKKLFLKEDSTKIIVPDEECNIDISNASISLALNVILKKFYSFAAPLVVSSVYPFVDAESGLTRYYDLKLNARFIDVKCINPKFSMPPHFSPQHTPTVEELKATFPLENFRFEGFMVIDVTEVTEEQIITEIKNALLNINAFSDVTVYDKLQQHIQSLLELNNVNIGITPFFKMNDYYLYADIHYENSLLFKNKEVTKDRDGVSDLYQDMFRQTNQPVLYKSITNSITAHNKIVKYYSEIGAKSLILCPLKGEDGQLIGILEVLSKAPDQLQFHHMSRLQSALALFTLALEKSKENLELQIDKTIKEHFTAVQPAVEWKFTEAAFNYLQHKQHSEMVKMHSITFQDVYPLYGAIDIRNSSTERNNAIQLDVLEQLNLARTVAERAYKEVQFPLLKETIFKLERYILSSSDTLLSDDELAIYGYLQNELQSFFNHLSNLKPELTTIIEEYTSALDPYRNIIYHHRKEYEESITRINDVLDRFIDLEQEQAQKIFPHYFERYLTDGIEFNIYIGQSLAPRYKFDDLYVRNLKIWQLSLLAKATRLTHALEKKLSLPLQTTQLILAHSIPLSISFRNKERKFDVDGAYNIRYEIVKKRIDKVHTRESGERLTQPGKIAIVYSQQKELNEYLEYIEFLKHENLFVGEVEYHELEELQGISGLKAIRIEVNLGTETSSPKVELSKVTSTELLNK